MVHSGHDIRLISDFVSSFLSALIKFRWPNIIILLLKMNCMRFFVCVTGSKLYCSNSGLPWVWNLNFHVISKFNATKIRFSKKATKMTEYPGSFHIYLAMSKQQLHWLHISLIFWKKVINFRVKLHNEGMKNRGFTDKNM